MLTEALSVATSSTGWSLPRSAGELLGCATPDAWLQSALQQQELLLIDHANCERKAAQSAITMISRYAHGIPGITSTGRYLNAGEKKVGSGSAASGSLRRNIDFPELLQKMSRLAREEMRHFEQVLGLMQARNIEYVHLSPSRYAGALHKLVRMQEPHRLLDTLLLGAFIEARSFERFKALAPLLDAELRKFYESLLKSEERHFQDYLKLAASYFDEDFSSRITMIAEREAELISSEDTEFRFHSGVLTS